MRFVFILFFLTSISFLGFTQNSINADSLFNVAREKAFSNSRKDAISICDSIIGSHPEYWDAYVLKGRVNAWNKNYPAARKILVDLLDKKVYNDGYRALMDVELWSKNYTDALVIADSAIIHYPNDIELQIKKAKAQFHLNEFDAAKTTLKNASLIDPENKEIIELLEKIKLASTKNEIGLTIGGDYFDQIYKPRHWLSLEYKRATKIGSIIPRLNLINRFGNTGVQAEIDAYLKFKPRFVLYLNYGVSTTTLFPDHRAGIELYKALGHGFEVSLGGRYLLFRPKYIIIYTGSVSKYFGNYLVSLRPFITPKTNGISTSFVLSGRKYFNDQLDNLRVDLSFGQSPDQQNIFDDNANDIVFLKNYQIGLNYEKSFKSYYQWNVGVNFRRLEASFSEIIKINAYGFEIGINRRF